MHCADGGQEGGKAREREGWRKKEEAVRGEVEEWRGEGELLCTEVCDTW